jgi:hypothetical protein
MASKARSRVPDDGVVEVLDAGSVQPHVVRGPPGAVLATGGQLADEFGQVTVVGVAASLGAQERDAGVRGVVPVGVEVRDARVEEVEPGEVRGPAFVVEDRCV